MDKLGDMTRFPWTVHLGASLNIVFSIWLTHQVFFLTGGRFFFFLPFAVGLVACNVLPVVILRARDEKQTGHSTIEGMNFFKDQHRFSSWVYGIASGNMLFWTVFAWWVFSINHSSAALVSAQLFSFCLTFGLTQFPSVVPVSYHEVPVVAPNCEGGVGVPRCHKDGPIL